MAAKKGASTKNDPSKRNKSNANLKSIDGKSVKPALYIDVKNGNRYMVAIYEDEKLATDEDGFPISWGQIA